MGQTQFLISQNGPKIKKIKKRGRSLGWCLFIIQTFFCFR
jgi:hypothetical protein